MDFREWFESVSGVVATFQFLLEAYERGATVTQALGGVCVVTFGDRGGLDN